MDSSKLAGLSKGQLIDEAANSITLLATRAGTRPEFYRVLVKLLRKLAVDVEVNTKDSTVIDPNDFKEIYDKLGGAPDSLEKYVKAIKSPSLMGVESGYASAEEITGKPQMPPPDNKILEDLLPPKRKPGRPRKEV